MPPAMALAHVSGPGSGAVIDQLRDADGVTVGGAVDNYLVRAATWEQLGAGAHLDRAPEGFTGAGRRRPAACV